MIRAYIIQRYFSHVDMDTINAHINSIKKEKPDCIFIVTLGEINVLYNCEHFFKGIQEYIVEQNIPIYVLWAGPNITLFPNVYGINTLGSAVGNVSCTNGAMMATNNINLLETADKLFTCYNNNAKYERKFLVDHLVKNDLLKDGIVTYRYPDNEVGHTWTYHDGTRLYDEEDYTINIKPEYTAGILPKSYMRGLIDIVCETDTQEGYFIPTEKNAKPWGTLKPYLVVSSMNYHKWLLEEYGIEPYTELFDYSFDSEKNIEDRVLGIIENIKKVRTQFETPGQKEQIYENLLPKLIKNRTAALETITTLKHKNKVIPNCLKFITESEYVLLGDVTNTQGGLHFYFDPEWHREYG